MGIKFDVQVRGNAILRLAHASKEAHEAIMKAVLLSAHDVQRRAKINVKQKLNTTGGSVGTLSRSIQVVRDDSRLEAAIGPSVIYGRIHEFGGVIRPKKGRFLVFTVGQGALKQARGALRKMRGGEKARSFRMVGGAKVYSGGGATTRGLIEEAQANVTLVFARQVTIPERPYLRPALDDATPAMEKRFEAVLKALF